MNLKPFWSYYGGKWRVARRYPAPLHDQLVEPFAGAAGYALRHYERQVVLIDKNPKIAALWEWLIHVSEDEVRRLPVELPADLRSLDVPDEARDLIGFWCNKGSERPRYTKSPWMRSQRYSVCFWGAPIRERIASQLAAIRHWSVVCASYEEIPDEVEATWFVDPPYSNKAGRRYPDGSHKLDFEHLGAWCRARRGQVIVCEAEGADWLPFKPFGSIQSNAYSKVSREVVWP